MTVWAWFLLCGVACGLLGWRLYPYRKPKEAVLTGWTEEYEQWLEELQAVIQRFPDQEKMEGYVYSDAQAHVINEINDLFADELYRVTTNLVLKGAQLRAKGRKT
jgi:hypothetical protein